MKKIILSIFTILALAAGVQAQTADTIKVTSKHMLSSQLKTGTKQYMVYFQAPARKKTIHTSLWVRDVKVGTRNSEPVIITTQHWYSADTNQYRAIVSVNRKADFSPVFHSETIGTRTRAYNWTAKNITGADTVAGNMAKNFKLDFDLPNFNWNLDIETFEQLPLADGKVFAINFYDAGSIPPAYTIYKVTGSEVLALYNNEKVDCWKLVTQATHKGNTYTQTFWISKKNHEFLKEEDTFNGGFRYKVKLPAGSPDVVARFAGNDG